jgi:acetylornithine deacetylase/succinyl-diaminopimelate desuccinylase-like protein
MPVLSAPPFWRKPFWWAIAPMVLLLACICTSAAQLSPPTAARQWHQDHRQDILQEFSSLLAIPNVASDAANINRNADALLSMLAKRGVQARLLKVPDAPPVVYGEIRTPGATRTLVFYAHYDGQPVSASDWKVTGPFTPVQKQVDGEPRIYARSSSDDKAAIIAQLAALDALRAANIALRSNIRFVWEGEEEAGSQHLGSILEANREAVTGDVWLICDGPVDQSGRQVILFGARGDTHLEITVYGPNHELHSGHYGNWAPNPAMMLVQLLAQMKDANGKVLIPHFYDGLIPLGTAENEAIAAAPKNDQKLRQELGLGHVDGKGESLLRLLNLPTLNINGLASARTGARANNVIPSSATADLDIRLVKGIDWRKEQDRVIDFIRSRGYFVVEHEPDPNTLLGHPLVAYVKRDLTSYNAVRTPMEIPISRTVIAAIESAHGAVIKLPTSGGSLPLESIERAVSAPMIIVPIANHDNNQHSADENIRLKNLWDGIETMAALLSMN